MAHAVVHALVASVAWPVLLIGAFDGFARTQAHRVRDPAKRVHTRWCLVHALVNACVAGLAFPGLVRTWTLADDALLHPVGRGCVGLAIALHIYHAVWYDLSSDDRVHHILFAFVLGGPSWVYATSPVLATLWFLSGVPGGVLYGVIVLRRWGWVDWHEPTWSLWINAALRLPGVVVCLVQLARLLAAHGASGLPVWVMAMQFLLPAANAAYYTWQSVGRALARV